MLLTEELLVRLRQGDERAFESVFRAYHNRIFAAAYRLLGSAQEAEDITQEAFLRLYLRPLPPGRDHNLLGWLLRVATNLGYNALRGRRRRVQREEQVTADPEVTSEPDTVASLDVAARVQATLAALPERQAQLLLLRQAGLSYAELAETLGVAPGSVGTLLARAEAAFRQRYDGDS